jgi:hypothetical protein
MGLYWKSIIVKVTGCDYEMAGKIERLVDVLCPNCTERQLIEEAPIAYGALKKLDEMSNDTFNKGHDKLTADEFSEFYDMLEIKPRPNIRFAA